MDERYSVLVVYRDGEWWATSPDLPGMSAFGSSREDAVHEAAAAIEAWIKAALAAGNPVPAPKPPGD